MQRRHPSTGLSRQLSRIAALVLAASVCLAGAAAAAGNTAPPAAVAPPAAAPPGDDNAAQYCRNIANPAADARYARQVDALNALAQALDERIATLEKKKAEYEEWVKRREDFMAKADDAVVAIYSQMRPDAASLQIAAMDEEAAAAILAKLNPRTASAILNEMDAGVAAHLTNVMTGLPSADKGARERDRPFHPDCASRGGAGSLSVAQR